jgi:hypothetical protein
LQQKRAEKDVNELRVVLVELLDLLINFGRSRRSDSGFQLPAGLVFIPQRRWFFVNSITLPIPADVCIDQRNRLGRLLTNQHPPAKAVLGCICLAL